MGAWSSTILGNDSALDQIDDIEYKIVEELKKRHPEINDEEDVIKLYGINKAIASPYFQESKLIIEEWLSNNQLAYENQEEYVDESEYYLIIGSIIMGFGIEMSESLKATLLKSADTDEWAEESSERRMYMNAFKEAVNKYKKEEPLYEPVEGLFAMVFEGKQEKLPEEVKWKTLQELNN